ncbi:hypothetical protein CTI14_43300, partial [Methylobacterium radiotolerans]
MAVGVVERAGAANLRNTLLLIFGVSLLALALGAAYKEQLQRLEDVGAGETPQAETLRQQIADPAN